METAGNDGEGNKSKPAADWMWAMKIRRKVENPAEVTEASVGMMEHRVTCSHNPAKETLAVWGLLGGA